MLFLLIGFPYTVAKEALFTFPDCQGFKMMERAGHLESDSLDSNPDFVTYQLYDPGKRTEREMSRSID